MSSRRSSRPRRSWLTAVFWLVLTASGSAALPATTQAPPVPPPPPQRIQERSPVSPAGDSIVRPILINAGANAGEDSILGGLRYVPPTGDRGFLQGSPEDEPCRRKDESQFTHVLTRPMAVMETEVTQGMWARLREAIPALGPDPSLASFGSGTEYPVQNVTWAQTLLFANLASRRAGLGPAYFIDRALSFPLDEANFARGTYFCDFTAPGYRLPTEGEWEWIARGGIDAAFPFSEPDMGQADCNYCPPRGFYFLGQHAWMCFNSGGKTHPVGSKLRSIMKLRDLLGNVREWCWDWKDSYPQGRVVDYPGPPSGTFKAIRGGGFNTLPRSARSACRYGGNLDAKGQGVGFRLVRTVAVPPPAP